jgi:hypothetical protein
VDSSEASAAVIAIPALGPSTELEFVGTAVFVQLERLLDQLLVPQQPTIRRQHSPAPAGAHSRGRAGSSVPGQPATGTGCCAARTSRRS